MRNDLELTKDDIKRKVEPFIYSRLIERGYAQKYIASRDLLTANRFDLGLKLAYLAYKNVLPELATEIYHHDIRSQTLGKYQEYGNDEKSSFEIYLEHFDKTFNDIKNNGFDENKSLIPLSSKGSILNGAHRLASAIFLGLDVACVQTELGEIHPNYNYFLDRNVPEDILDIGALSFGDYAENSYLAFLWPSGRQKYNHTESLFTDVVYKKTIKLNANGAFNLLVELYKHMEWLGATNSNFHGAHKKLMECFTDFDEFTIILFQCDSLEKVQQLKKRVRDINKIGFSSVHITDTKEEVNRISRLIFNKNALHFLNYAEPYKFKSTTKMVQSLFVLDKEILKKLVLDGSMTLSVYGLREARDIDYFSEQSNITYEGEFDFEAHDSQLKFHKIEKHELIYNPKYYFEYLGVRFVSFKQTFEFKKNRNEIKDKNDCQMMALLIDKNSFRYVYANLKQKIFYKKLIIKSRFKEFTFVFLRVTGTYEFTRKLYRKIKGRS